MRRIEFPDWAEVLGQAELSPRAKHSFEITIRWYLSFCRRARAEVTVQSARDFIAWAVEEKHPQPWQVEEWKEAVRWFFLAAKEQQCQVEGARPAWLPERSQGWPEWKVAFLTAIRRRNYSYRTEESYLVWIQRFAQDLGTEDLRSQGSPQIAEFLDSLALNERLSVSSQRQALNALVFLYREVFQKELGDFSQYRRAKTRTNLPVWLTWEELKRLFECLDDHTRLMAQVMYGSGLRLMELACR